MSHRKHRNHRKPKSLQQWLNDLFTRRDDQIAAAMNDLMDEKESAGE